MPPLAPLARRIRPTGPIRWLKQLAFSSEHPRIAHLIFHSDENLTPVRRDGLVRFRRVLVWSSDLTGLRAFLARTPACAAAVLAYNGKEAVKLDDRLFAIPMGRLLE
jgi:hypothetical protein